MRPLVTFWLWLALAAVSPARGQSSFAGTWKMNQERSQLAGDTMKFAPAAEDGIVYTAGGIQYSFRIDGNNYRTPSGNLAIWRQSGPDSWSTEYRKMDGKLLSTDSWKLSPDGQTLSVISTGVKAGGEPYTDTETYVRTAGGKGLLGALIGSWKAANAKLSSPNLLIIQEARMDGLILKIPAMQATCEANFGGREAAVEGPDVPTGLRLSLARKGPYSFSLVQKLNGTLIRSAQYTVSEDGKTMTEVGGAPGDPPASIVWEKQLPAPASPAIPSPGVH